MSELGDLALRYAGWGLAVFPLQARGKRPMVAKKDGGNGFHDATTDKARVEAWWRRWPNANIGIATGASGWVVVDVDGPEGQAQLRAAVAKHGDGTVLPTLTIKTGREGGFHLIYGGTGVPSSQREGEYLDVRGSTGYVVAPGSIHSNGNTYSWALQMMPQPVPAWVARFVAARGLSPLAAQTIAPPSVFLPQGGRLSDRLADCLERQEWSPHEEARLRSALRVIPASLNGKTWFSYLAALHDLRWRINGRDLGLDIADEWSATSAGRGDGLGLYRGRHDVEKRWASCDKEYNGLRATVGSIYRHAQELGWSGDSVVSEPEKPKEMNGVYTLPAALTEQSSAIRFVDLDKHGNPRATCVNTRSAIRMLGLVCQHDTFHDKLKVGGHLIDQWAGELTDNAVHMIRVAVHQAFRFDPGSQDAHDAVVQECLQHAYDPVQDYLDGLRWDGQPRLDTWMTRYMGADDTLLNRAISRLVLLAAVRRAREPGVKFDQIVVLIGPEGRGKSSAVEILAGEDCFSDQTILALDDRGQQEAIQGVWLYEIADLAGMSRADVEKVKAFASRRTDRARPAYARARLDRPRRCIFLATTNNETFLLSQTGNRRFWPVQTDRLALECLARDRDQLWAEAATLEDRGHTIALPESLWRAAAEAQDMRRDHDPWDDMLGGVKGTAVETPNGTEYRISTRNLLEMTLRVPAEKQSTVTLKRLAFTMRRLGWDGPKLLRDGDFIGRGYTRSA